MKNIWIVTTILLSVLASGQQKKSNKTPPPIKPPAVTLKEDKISESTDSGKKCFHYIAEEKKGSMVYLTENLLEYGWISDNARMVVTAYQYDPATKKQGDKEGLVYTKSLQFINGNYKIEKDNLIFTPEKSDQFQKKIFNLRYKAKTKDIDRLEDEAKHVFKSGNCLTPTVSM